MVIYAEYLFLENFIIGMIILILTSKICGIKPKKVFLVLGGVLCGIYSFTIFFEDMSNFLAVVSKLAFSGLVVVLVFWPGRVKLFGKIILIFYIVSFAMGGITIGAMYFFGAEGVTNNSSTYISGPTYINVAFGCFLTYLAMSGLASFLKGRLLNDKTIRQVEIFLNEKVIVVNGLVDTGNFLRDPISGKPVSIISKRIAVKILPEDIVDLITKDIMWDMVYKKIMETEFCGRLKLIPFHSVGKNEGMLIGFRSDSMIIKDKQGERKMDGAILAISQEHFARGSKEFEYDLLLNREVLEGGIACDV
ncbi:sigma-E processing peptidase SpoIIGA [Anaerovorax odorimutans]|uniref:sigma-E processing peptidase SpoIIGA n=1 Tax=Anaerovorax odorimutans TaxID=109327 RepID=UPI0004804515|nr:sigma-E processing peptidase SpoIIGA [Anaerovorax odorimutans]